MVFFAYKDPMRVHGLGREKGKVVSIAYREFDFDRMPLTRRFLAHAASPYKGRYFRQEFDERTGELTEHLISDCEALNDITRLNNAAAENAETYFGKIKLYQLSPNELEAQTGATTRIVNTGRSDVFLEADDLHIHNRNSRTGIIPRKLVLRFYANYLGADALACYQAASPARATPVKFVEKTD